MKDWLQLVATSSVASCLVLRNLATSPVASCLKFGQKDWTGLDFKTLVVRGWVARGTVWIAGDMKLNSGEGESEKVLDG